LAMRATFFAVLLNLILNAVLIPQVGMVGAAIATLAAEPLVCGLMLYYAAQRGLPMLPMRRLVKPIVAVVAMAAALYWLDSDGLVLQLAVGGLTYGLVLALVGGIGRRGKVPILRV
jgi:O-antigen/teichoic acid export membrane protein